MAQIAEHVGVHYMTVSRAVRSFEGVDIDFGALELTTF